MQTGPAARSDQRRQGRLEEPRECRLVQQEGLPGEVVGARGVEAIEAAPVQEVGPDPVHAVPAAHQVEGAVLAFVEDQVEEVEEVGGSVKFGRHLSSTGLAPEPVEDHRGTDPAGPDAGELTAPMLGEHQERLGEAGAGGQQRRELPAFLELIEAPEGGDHLLARAALLPAVLHDLQVRVALDRLLSEEHGGLRLTPEGYRHLSCLAGGTTPGVGTRIGRVFETRPAQVLENTGAASSEGADCC